MENNNRAIYATVVEVKDGYRIGQVECGVRSYNRAFYWTYETREEAQEVVDIINRRK